MKKHLVRVGLVALVLCLSVTFLTGCAKKSPSKGETAINWEQKRALQETATAPAGDEAGGERALREQALREQALRDQSIKDTAAKDARGAVENAGRDAVIPKELQIPDIHFEYDRFNLTPEAQAILKAGAPAFLKHREYKLVVEGHGDERGTVEYNLALGDKRAAEAAKYLVGLGIEKGRIRTISYGKEMPLDKGHDEAAWAKNRRAHFVVFPPTKN